MKSFETYLKENKQKLRKQVDPESDLWKNIENRLYRRKINRIVFITGIAASLALLLAFGAYYDVHFNNRQKNILPLYSYSKAYGDIEKEYLKEVDYELKLINGTYLPKIKIKDLNSFKTGLKALDKAYEGYCEIIQKEGCDEIMMELIIDNYTRKIELLESLQSEIKKIKKYENEINSKDVKFSL